ncbi:MAG: TIGR00725 family protein [Dehalococcoidia bacterium]|nr:TIGR00725 family protein [Dehalococcoidia bacterium]
MIAVVGGDPCTPDEASVAFALGREIAGRGHVVVCGGRGGVMREACRGARTAGGHTVGILPGEDAAQANEFVEFAITTGLGHARNAVVARTAAALIAVGGCYGTLSEIAFALIFGRPVAGLGTWTLLSPAGEAPPVVPFDSPADALDYCERAARKDRDAHP